MGTAALFYSDRRFFHRAEGERRDAGNRRRDLTNDLQDAIIVMCISLRRSGTRPRI